MYQCTCTEWCSLRQVFCAWCGEFNPYHPTYDKEVEIRVCGQLRTNKYRSNIPLCYKHYSWCANKKGKEKVMWAKDCFRCQNIDYE